MRGGGFKPQSFAVFPWLLGSMVAMGFGSDVASYHGDWGLCQGVGGTQPWLLRQLGDGSLVFEGIDERQDSSLYAGRDPTGYRVTRG